MNIEEAKLEIKSHVEDNMRLNERMLEDVNSTRLKTDGCIKDFEDLADIMRGIEHRTVVNDTLQWVLDMLEVVEMPTNRVYMPYSTMLYCKLSVLKDMADEEDIDDATREYRRGKLIGAVSAVADIYGYSFNRVDTDLGEVAR